MNRKFKIIVTVFACIFAASGSFSADRPDILILYPKPNSLVGKKVNLVLDPTDIPYFQVFVNKLEYPVIDTARGAHALQGLPMDQGTNVIKVNVLAADEKEKNKFTLVASRSVTVFNREGSFSPVPANFTQENFHTRERESSCGSCHRLEVGEQDQKYSRPEEMLCYNCHREIPKGEHIHGPAAVWNCLACHNPDLYPAKYAFSSVEPWKVVKTTQPVYPPDLKVTNSQKLPMLKDHERVSVNAAYHHGPLLKKVRIVEQVPKGMQYVKASGVFRNRPFEPKINGDKLIWEIGDVDSNFSETLLYTLKKEKGAGEVPLKTRIVYPVNDRELSREFDPKQPSRRGSTLMEICLKCHEGIADKKFRHGPVEAGYCNLCHDPHASPNPAWLRKDVWNLCTTCHADKGTGVHVIAGFVTGQSHPTSKRPDPARPGKRLSCSSCHEPHSAGTRDFFAYNAKTRFELCDMCHKK